jgi:hypothetical protein
MTARCFIQLKPTFSMERKDAGTLIRITATELTQKPPRSVYDGAAVVCIEFEVDERIFNPERIYPTATITVDETQADIKPAIVTAMAKAKFL